MLTWNNIYWVGHEGWGLEVFSVNPKRHGGGNLPIDQDIACHFSQDHTLVTKFLEFILKHPNYKVVKSFFYYLGRFFRNSAETEPRLWFFGIKNHKIIFFFNFFITKSSNLISNLNDNCSQLSFEVYNVCVAQKLQISEFFDGTFFRLDPRHFGDLPRLQFQPQEPQYGIKF